MTTAMDTENTSQINAFTSGMDSDTSYGRIKDGSYIEAHNIRVLPYCGSSTIGNKHGSIAPINGITEVGVIEPGNSNVSSILYSGAVRDIAAVVYIMDYGDDSYFCISTFKNKIGDTQDTGHESTAISPKLIFKAKITNWPEDKTKWPKRVSVVFRYEDDDNIKMYIATGIAPIFVVNLAKSYINNTGTLDDISQYPKCTFHKPVFLDYAYGKLKPALVCYSYQLYGNYGTYTDISPACQTIPIVNLDQTNALNVENAKGEEFGEESGCGIKLSIEVDVNQQILDRIRIFRITYQQNGQLPTIECIFSNTYSLDNGKIYFTDTGTEALESFTVEEYNSLSGIHIIPNSIEQKDNMLFAANVTEQQTAIDTEEFKNWDARAFRANSAGKIIFNSEELNVTRIRTWDQLSTISESKDKTDLEAYNEYNDVNTQYAYKDLGEGCTLDRDGYYGGTGVNVSWRFIVTYVPIDTCTVASSKSAGTAWNIHKLESTPTTSCYFIHHTNGLVKSSIPVSNEPGRNKNSWLTKSLRRNELYRYGIILYDKNGNASPAKWIADIRTPNLFDENFNTFISHYDQLYDLASLPLGVAFNVQNLPEGCTGYEIVRCARRQQDIATITQGVISKPIVQYLTENKSKTQNNVYFPTGFLTTAKAVYGTTLVDMHENEDHYSDDAFKKAAITCASNLANYSTYQFVSPEFSYQPEYMKVITKRGKLKLEQLRYIYGVCGVDNYHTVSKSSGVWFSPCSSNLNFIQFNSSDWKVYEKSSREKATQDSEYAPTYSHNKCYLKIPSHVSKSVYYCSTLPDKSQGGYIDQIIEQLLSKPWSYTKAGYRKSVYEYEGAAKKMQDIAGKVFSYVKLYEQAAKCRNYIVDTTAPFDDGPITTETAPSGSMAAINDINIASNLKWNEVIKQKYQEKGTNSETKESGRWWFEFEYSNHFDSIGSSQFCNVQFGGAHGMQLDKGGDFGDDDWTIGQDCIDGAGDPEEYLKTFVNGGDMASYVGNTGGNIGRFVFSTGGSCGLINLDLDTSSPIHPIGSEIGAAKRYINQNNVLSSTTDGVDFTISDSTGDQVNKIDVHSLLGTSLCNIRKNVVPYNGHSLEAIDGSVYYSNGQYFENTNGWNGVFDGDVVISVFEYTAQHKAMVNFTKGADASKSRDIDDYRTSSAMVTYAIPVESTVNCMIDQGYKFSKQKSEDASLIQQEPANVDGLFSQTQPEYVYNTAYSAENMSRMHAAYDNSNTDDFNKSFDYRCRNSQIKENNEHMDSWCKFQSSNFIDVDSQLGKITHLKNFNNQLLFWQQQAMGVLSVNDRAITQDQNSASIILGTGGVLSRYDYLDYTSGMHSGEFCTVASAAALYWYDHHNAELRQYAGGIKPLSKQSSVQNILFERRDKDQLPLLFFDNKNNEVISKVLNGDTSLVFNEAVSTYPSIYTIPFDGSVTFNNGVYLLRNEESGIHVAQWDKYNEYSQTWDGVILPTYISYVVNNNPITTKVFDSQEIVTPQDEMSNTDNKRDRDSYFSNNHNYKWRTESMVTENTLKRQMTIREHNYRYAIPRENGSGLFGSRMRGKYLICDITDNKPRTDVAISYIITKFRQSCS